MILHFLWQYGTQGDDLHHSYGQPISRVSFSIFSIVNQRENLEAGERRILIISKTLLGEGKMENLHYPWPPQCYPPDLSLSFSIFQVPSQSHWFQKGLCSKLAFKGFSIYVALKMTSCVLPWLIFLFMHLTLYNNTTLLLFAHFRISFFFIFQF